MWWSPGAIGHTRGHGADPHTTLLNLVAVTMARRVETFSFRIKIPDLTLQMAKILVQKRADIRICNHEGWTPLHLAVYNGHARFVTWLLSQEGVDPSATTGQGNNCLHLAAQQGHVGLVELLHDGMDVNAKNAEGRTALYLAVLGNHEEIAQLLIEKGATVKDAERNGWSPLHVASIKGFQSLSKYLMSKGANILHYFSLWQRLTLTAPNGDTPPRPEPAHYDAHEQQPIKHALPEKFKRNPGGHHHHHHHHHKGPR